MRKTMAVAFSLLIALLLVRSAATQDPAADNENARESARRALCQNNLSQLYKAMHVYVSAYGRNKLYPPHTGTAFWTCLAGCCGDTQRHRDAYFARSPCFGNPDLYKCPSAKTSKGTVDYLGPRKLTPEGTLSALEDGLDAHAPLAADRKGNHAEGGNVLLFDGSVKFLKGEEYEQALKGLQLFPDVPLAVAPPTKDLPAAEIQEIDRLVAQLGDDTFAKRAEAEAKLRAVGEAARPALARAIGEGNPPEIQARAARVLSALGRTLDLVLSKNGSGDVLLDGKPVTGNPARAVLERLTAAFRLRTDLPAEPAPGLADRVAIHAGPGVDQALVRTILDECAKEDAGMRVK
jgi:prepilin-type processing-associated H-X9-DG protein